MYKLVAMEDRDIDFWDTIQHFTEKLFLVPCPPKSLLSIVSNLSLSLFLSLSLSSHQEVQLAEFSSPTILLPPRGG